MIVGWSGARTALNDFLAQVLSPNLVEMNGRSVLMKIFPMKGPRQICKFGVKWMKLIIERILTLNNLRSCGSDLFTEKNYETTTGTQIVARFSAAARIERSGRAGLPS